ncbi:LysR family transcriptional regulator [Primorskyibacter sp. S87]|uniref:LysR family transcriptional regulator n=1 Tax=Primorskyibacter sp. S87 TaxID=3415126 RepID=UPI003C7A5652
MITYTLKQLRYVETAGRLGSITKAAEELNISQSSITAAIDSLENSLDYDLFVRTPAKGIQPTPSGAEALRLIRNLIDQSRHFDSEVRTVGSDAKGLVRIGCYATAAPSFLPPILEAVSLEFPGISIKLLEGHMERMVEFLDNGEADLAFTYSEALDSRHDFLPLFEAPFYALVAAQDRLATRGDVSLAELAERPMVMLDLPLARDRFIQLFESRGLSCSIAHTSRSAEICRTLVAGGYGFCILNILPPDYPMERMPYRALRIRDAGPGPTFGIATMAGVRQPKTVRAFRQSCLQLSRTHAFDHITV